MVNYIYAPNGTLPEWVQVPQQTDGLDCAHLPLPVLEPCEDEIRSSVVSWPFTLQLLVLFINFTIQLLAIFFVYTKKHFRKGSFFIMLMTLSINVVLRSVVFITTIVISAYTNKDSLPNIPNILARTIALHMDYCTDYFSMVLIFFMALNRCLFFISENWNNRIFKRVWIPIVFSLISGVVSSEIIIFTNGMNRLYLPSTGYIDYGVKRGLRYIINRIFHLFPFGAICCYAILFCFLKKENRKIAAVENPKNPKNRGDQKVFVQLLFTSLFYSIMTIIVEMLQSIEFSVAATQVLCAILNITNYLPEISLPFLLVWESIRQRKKVAVVVNSSQTNGRQIS